MPAPDYVIYLKVLRSYVATILTKLWIMCNIEAGINRSLRHQAAADWDIRKGFGVDGNINGVRMIGG